MVIRETTSRSPTAADVLVPSLVVCIGYAGDTRVGKAWTIAGGGGRAAVGVFTAYGVGVPVMTPVRVVGTFLYRCGKRSGDVESVGVRDL